MYIRILYTINTMCTMILTRLEKDEKNTYYIRLSKMFTLSFYATLIHTCTLVYTMDARYMYICILVCTVLEYMTIQFMYNLCVAVCLLTQILCSILDISWYIQYVHVCSVRTCVHVQVYIYTLAPHVHFY